MQVKFYKYQGAGNDFVMIDNRKQWFDKTNQKLIEKLCDRKFGIGSDGLICLENESNFDFKMIYFNADGNESTMCGNGGRCIVAFAKYLNIINDKANFIAIDGVHKALINNGIVSLQMQNVSNILLNDDYVYLNSGSPHHINYFNNIGKLDVKQLGSKIRYSEPYLNEGTNVNFVEQLNNDTFKVRTYERGVENETLSCGTGATAVAIASHRTGKTDKSVINLKTKGGSLKVSFTENNGIYKNVYLEGSAVQVFEGKTTI